MVAGSSHFLWRHWRGGSRDEERFCTSKSTPLWFCECSSFHFFLLPTKTITQNALATDKVVITRNEKTWGTDTRTFFYFYLFSRRTWTFFIFYYIYWAMTDITLYTHICVWGSCTCSSFLLQGFRSVVSLTQWSLLGMRRCEEQTQTLDLYIFIYLAYIIERTWTYITIHTLFLYLYFLLLTDITLYTHICVWGSCTTCSSFIQGFRFVQHP